MNDNPRYEKGRLLYLVRHFAMWCLVAATINCDFESPSKFKLPTWFVDIEFPLVHESYSLGGMVDTSNNIWPAADSGMQIIFTDSLPNTAIDESYLEVNFSGGFLEVDVPPEPVAGPAFDFPATVIDTVFSLPLVLYDTLVYVDTAGNPFSIPTSSNKIMTADNWNTLIADVFNNAFQPIQVSLQVFDKDEITLPQDPALIERIDALVISEDPQSYFGTIVKNIGIPKAVINTNIDFRTGDSVPLDNTLAVHNANSSIEKDVIYSDSTSLSNARLRSWIEMNIDLEVETETDPNLVTIATGDSLLIDLRLTISIPGVDSADVQIGNIDLSPDIPAVAFPSDIEIYKGVFAGGATIPPNVNKLVVSDLENNFPFDIDFLMDFKNFLPPPGNEEVKIDTVLERGVSHDYNFDLRGDTIASSGYPDDALTELELDVSAIINNQPSTIPLDGSSLGDFSLNIRMYSLKFNSLEANLIEEFPPTEQELAGMPQGFTGMAFTDVKIEFIMLNQIQLPVELDITMIGINTYGDSMFVCSRAAIGIPVNAIDTAKTVIRLSNLGTTTIYYSSPSDTVPDSSFTLSPTSSCPATIVDLLSFNPSTMNIDAAARIDGRGTIVVGASIGGAFKLIAPFEVRMDPMTFIPVVKTPIQEMDYSTRNRIRTSLFQTELRTTIINSIPVGGEISMLLSNKTYFPLDTTAEMLSVYKDSMVVQEGWSASDSLYVITNCEALNPELGNLYIFEVMDDYRNCMDGLVYLVRNNGSVMDTVISYVDTLLRIILPDPLAYYADTSTTGHPGAVAVPGELTHTSIIDTNRIYLLTDYGDHYVVPRFHLNGTDGRKVYLTQNDNIDVQSSITFRISSTGMLEDAPNELVVLYPNGGETLYEQLQYAITWKSYGNIRNVDIDYATGSNPASDDWVSIAAEIVNIDSFLWNPITSPGILDLTPVKRDSVRIRVSESNAKINDISGWYFKILQDSQLTPASVSEPAEPQVVNSRPQKKQ